MKGINLIIMARAKKNGHTLNCIVKDLEYKSLNKFSEITGHTKTNVIEKAIKVFIENYNFLDKNNNILPKMSLEEFLDYDFSDKL